MWFRCRIYGKFTWYYLEEVLRGMGMKLSIALEILNEIYQEHGEMEFRDYMDEGLCLTLEIRHKFNSLSGLIEKEHWMRVSTS